MNTGDLAWVLISAALVWLMTPGLALFYGGLGEKRNLLHTMFVPVVIIGIASIVWFAVGYSLAFGGEGTVIGNLNHVFLTDVSFTKSTKGLTIPDGAFALFQGMFPIITAAIITGSIIGRVRIKAMIVFMILWLIVIYTPLAHMVWGGGFSLAGLYFHYHGTIVKIGWQRQRFVRNTQTLEWYKTEYPQCVVTTNIVKCCFCESTSIRRYALKNNTYKIRNSCAKCGEVLFYTDED